MKELFKFEKDYLGKDSIHILKKQGDTSYAAHRHDYYEIIFYQRCGGSCILNGYEYPISDSCLFLLTPKDFHRIDSVNTENSRSVIVSFSESVADAELLRAIGFTARVIYSPSERTVGALEALSECYASEERHRLKKLSHLLSAILCDILEYGESVCAENPYLSPYVKSAMTLVMTDTAAYSSLTAVASACGISAPYFSDLFRRETGMTFTDWLSGIRIERARRMLEETDASALDICYDCGYNTPSQFIRVFKRLTGVTPSEYRKKKRS